MNSQSLFRSSSCIFFFSVMICINHAVSESEAQDSYTQHCSSVLPRYNITARRDGESLPSLSSSFTGGHRFQRGGNSYYQKNLRLRLRPDHYKTTVAGVYKVEGFLSITLQNGYKDADGGLAPVKFPMNGFWSERSRKLCMVGSTSWQAVDFDAVLKLKFDDENPTIRTGVVSGSLESTVPAGSRAYFDPILIFDFPASVPDYSYSLVSEEISNAFRSRKGESLSLDSTEFCSVMERVQMSLELGYATECAEQRRRPHLCSPLGVTDDFLPKYVSLTSIQCTKGTKKARFLATFQNLSGYGYENFGFASTVIGEAWWDDESNRIIGAACGLLNPSIHFGDSVGDCSMRLSFRQPSVLTLRNDAKIEGEIWSSKAAEDSGYFRRINLTINEDYGVSTALSEQRYKYTDLERVRKYCPQKKAADGKKKGNDEYPDAQSSDMRFDLNVQSELASAFATPVWVENSPFKGAVGIRFASDVESSDNPPLQELDRDAEERGITRPIEISYRIMMQPSYRVVKSSTNASTPRLDWPVMNPHAGVAITAEGFYDAGNGNLCMVGCRKLARNSVSTFKDCELVVELELPLLNGEQGRLVKGILRSTRPKTDPLHFDDLAMESFAYNRGEAERSIWRMDLEIAMVLISSTLLCIFVAMQIFHVKRNPEFVSSVSIAMLLILCLGLVIPLVLNFEAVFLGYPDKRTIELGNGGRLEAYEVAVRIITLVALLLQLRLLQLVFTSKSSWIGERRAGFVYVLGCLLAFILRKTYGGGRYSVWVDLKSYGGVILDGFLLPQILLNVVGGSAEEALRRSFYFGTSATRLMPHAYNQYRARNCPKYDLKETYYYANPAAYLYSTARDIIIPFGIIAFAVIVFLQQRKGGRCILPQRFRGFEKI